MKQQEEEGEEEEGDEDEEVVVKCSYIQCVVIYLLLTQLTPAYISSTLL